MVVLSIPYIANQPADRYLFSTPVFCFKEPLCNCALGFLLILWDEERQKRDNVCYTCNMKKTHIITLISTAVILIIGIIVFTLTSSEVVTNDRSSTPASVPKKSIVNDTRVDFSSLSPIYRFSAVVPNKWAVEFIKETQALNIYDPNLTANTNLEKSQFFIRYFEANQFSTLSTVTFFQNTPTTSNGRPAVRYEIEKKSGVPVFPNQPLWRSKRHKLIDIRLAETSPSLFYVFAYNPSVPDEVFEKFINSIQFHNDKQSYVHPMDDTRKRVTKKPFGITLSPGNSPVSPERFSGTHTAIDLEILPGEEISDVSVRAICGGRLRLSRQDKGYGGLAVQECLLENQPITVIYGHLRLSSITARVGEYLRPGDFVAMLGTGFTDETDNERKHLHLGIHKGTNIDTRGYVSSKAELSNWLDPLSIL